MLEIKIKNTVEKLKFNYRAFFKANSELSTQAGANDGASNLWLSFVTNDPNALFNALKVLLPSKYTDDDIFSALDGLEDKNEVDTTFKALEEELRQSSFFQRAAKRWIELTEKYDLSSTKEPKTDEEKIQASVNKDMLAAMKESL